MMVRSVIGVGLVKVLAMVIMVRLFIKVGLTIVIGLVKVVPKLLQSCKTNSADRDCPLTVHLIYKIEYRF